MTDFKRHAERLRDLDARIGSPICLEAADAIDQLLALAKPEPGALSQRIKQSIEDGTFAVQSAKPASSPAGGDVRVVDWITVAKAAGAHGVRYRTNRALEEFLTEITAALSKGDANG